MMAAEPLTATWHGSAGHSKTWLHTENTPANGDQGRAKAGREKIVGHKVKKYIITHRRRNTVLGCQTLSLVLDVT